MREKGDGELGREEYGVTGGVKSCGLGGVARNLSTTSATQLQRPLSGQLVAA
jgi:hypothetical protein